MFHKRFYVINSIYSGQLQFSDSYNSAKTVRITTFSITTLSVIGKKTILILLPIDV
jgi:hypothetical protein